MNRGAKQNWFESPHSKNGFWLFHDDKFDLFNSSRIPSQERFTFLTPSHQSRPYEIDKNHKNYAQSYYENQTSKFDDINLPDMFTNTIIERPVINQKLSFEESSIISEENDFQTPSRYGENGTNQSDNVGKDLPKTAAKQGHLHHGQQKKPRPKQKGLRMLSQKAYEIVTKMNGATYKQVANKLVDELAVQDTVQINQNIKRRVYDALNVLIALGILKKEGRKIYGLRGRMLVDEEKHDEFKNLYMQNQIKRQNISEKTKRLKEQRLKAQTIKALIKRNTLLPVQQNRINFPFCACNLDQNDEVTLGQFKKNIKMKGEAEEITIALSQKGVSPLGDVDAIILLRTSLRNFID